MRINTIGRASKDYAPDQISTVLTFNIRRLSYDEALDQGSQCVSDAVNEYVKLLECDRSLIHTHRYDISEVFHYVDKKQADGETRHIRIRDGYTFSQKLSFKLPYNNQTLAKILSFNDGNNDAPHINVEFELSDPESLQKELIPEAFADAKSKVEIAAHAANLSQLRCGIMDLEGAQIDSNSPFFEEECNYRYARCATASIDSSRSEEMLRRINDSFTPELITVSLSISTAWEVK